MVIRLHKRAGAVCGLALILASALTWAQASLVELVEERNFAAALELINGGVDVNQPSVDGTTALHWAVYHGNAELARRLLRAEADPGASNDYGSSPMGEAAARGSQELLAILLDAGADVESPNPEGQTALMAVARTGNVAAAHLLIERGAKVNAVEAWGGQTALMWAAARRHGPMVSLLLAHGAEVDKRAIDRDWDRKVTSEPRVKEMLTGGFTAMLYAVRQDCLDCVAALLEGGADIDKPDPDNVSPLILALLNMRFDIAKHLVEQGADVNAWDYWGRTPLYAAADVNSVPGSARGDLPPVQNVTGLEVARLMLERGANPDLSLKLYPPARNIVFDRAGDYTTMMTGATPLQHAAYSGDIDMMKLLLEFGANLELGNVHGVTPMIALTNRGGSRGQGKTETDMMNGLKVLLDAGADINQRGGRYDETPLHATARLNFRQVVSFLVEQGADLYAEDNRGLIPLDYATGKADTVSFGSFNVVGELPEMAALLRGYMGIAEDGPSVEN